MHAFNFRLLQVCKFLDVHIICTIRIYAIQICTYRFRQNRSCETALLRLSKLFFDTRRLKQYIYVITIDFTHAYDTINLNILQDTIGSFASTTIASWFSSYLCKRQQTTKYCNAISDSVNLNSGVPQGSVLEPSLFNIYINNLLSLFKPGEIIAYADNLTLVCSGTSPSEVASKAERLIATVSTWSTNHGLVLNAQKCEALFISPFTCKVHQTVQQLAVGSRDSFIKCVHELRLLGVLLSNDLKWHANASRT